MRVLLSLFMLALGCGSQAPYVATTAPGTPVLSHPAPPPLPDPAAYETAAWRHFQRRDYVRALRLAYHAAELVPRDPRPLFLAALIYDRGLDRPDLALIEYDRIFERASGYPALAPMRPRLYHLYRVAQQRAAQAALNPDHVPPLAGKPLAIFPFQTWQRDKTGAAVSLALTDLLLYDLEKLMGSDQVAPLQVHLLHRTFQNAFPDAGPDVFARWVGAARTLSGQIVQHDAHRLSIVAKLFDEAGNSVAQLPVITGSLNDLPALREVLLSKLANALDLALPPSLDPQPITSPLALNLHARGLDAYLSGDGTLAWHLLTGAADLAPNSPLVARWRTWVHTDLEGARAEADLTAIYQKLALQPDAAAASKRRLQATHDLVAPAFGLEGNEPLSPYKSPQPETRP